MTHVAAAFSARLREGTTAYAAFCGLPDASVPEILVREGFEAAIVDMQHGAFDYALSIQAISNVALAGKPAIVRVPVNSFPIASRMFDAGATGVMAPMINTVEDARQFVSFCKFPPVGERSWGPHRALALTGMGLKEYLHAANDFSLAIAMIETRSALAALDDILAIEGLDGVFVGPSDLSIALTNGATVDSYHPEVDKALDHIGARCRAHGKIASAFAMDGRRAKEVGAKGFQLVSIATDGLILRAGAKAALAEAMAGSDSKQAAY